MGDSPLRFGDIEEDGPQEIVIMLNGLFMVFSPQYGRIVFAEYLDESDWMTSAEMTQFFSHKPVTSVQYASRVLAEMKDIHSATDPHRDTLKGRKRAY